MIVREVHALRGTLMIVVAVTLRIVDEGGRGLIGLAVLGFFVLLSSYDPSERRTRRQ